MTTKVGVLFLACAGACGGGGGAAVEKTPSYTPVSATADGDVYTLQLGDLKMVVDGARGARVTELSLFGTNVLVTREQSHDTYGITYWPSPQASWCAAGGGCWPPLAAVDSLAYTGGVGDASSIQLTSGEAPVAQFDGSAIAVTKQFVPVPEHGAIDVTYTLTNTAASVNIGLAPWQVSRVATGGLTFFGQATGDVAYALNSDPTFAVTDAAGDRWYQSAPVSHDSKALSDGTGWLAHVTPDRLLYLASASDIQPSDSPPGEAEIEVFTNHDYVELEQQGALTPLAAGDALTWTVRWKLRRVPASTTVAAGNADLAAFASSVLAE